MNRTEAITYIKKIIREADSEELQRIICATNGPLCSDKCPLKDKFSTECKKIIFDEKI